MSDAVSGFADLDLMTVLIHRVSVYRWKGVEHHICSFGAPSFLRP